MELKQLYYKTLQLFGIYEQSDGVGAKELGKRLMDSLNNAQIMDSFCEIVGGDLTKDWLQMIFQYYLADRRDKKQDYTPKSLAMLMGKLAGESDIVIDLCAGSGALTIQRWMLNKDQRFELYELDENVIPFLLFNLSVRNIEAIVHRADVLNDEIYQSWQTKKGEKFAKVSAIESTL